MKSKEPNKKDKQSLDEYFNQANSWEADRYKEAKKSAKRACIIAYFSFALTAVSVLAVALLTPLKTVEPFVIRVDNSTGIVDIVTALKEGKETYDEAVNKYFIAKYITNRESYDYQTRNFNYRVVGLMSSPEQATLYGEWFDPRKNPDAPLKIFGEYGSCAITIKNISFIEKQVALVRFTKTVSRGPEKVTSHWIATTSFRFSTAQMKADDRLINPLGFQCIDYRLDPETVGQ